MNDGVLFISVALPAAHCVMFSCDTYLYRHDSECAGKLMYADKPVHGSLSIEEEQSEPRLYRAAYRRTAEQLVEPVRDLELQEIGVSLGLRRGDGIDAHLCLAPNSASSTRLLPPRFLEVCRSAEAVELADEIGRVYNTSPADLMLTGGLHLFPRPITEAHDVDVVVPVDDMSQLNSIRAQFVAGGKGHVTEYGYLWPLRWRSSRSHLVCPFFVYRGFQPYAGALAPTGHTVSGPVSIIDDLCGVFNAPVLIVSGSCDLILCRATLLRGIFRRGHRLQLEDCPIYTVTDGPYKGASASVVTNSFSEIANLGEIIDEYKA